MESRKYDIFLTIISTQTAFFQRNFFTGIEEEVWEN